MEKIYRIADLTVAMDTYGRTEKQALQYLTSDYAKVDFKIQPNAIPVRKHMPKISDDDAEYMATGTFFYNKLVDYDGIMLHSSAVVVEGMAYLFTASSGTGKSTHTNLWLQQFGDDAYILNDDKPALRLINNRWYVYGTPWSGKTDKNVNECSPLAGIAVLKRAEDNSIEPYAAKEAIKEIYNQINRQKDINRCNKILDLLDNLLTTVPIWQLKCNMNPDAAVVAYTAMSQKGEKYAE